MPPIPRPLTRNKTIQEKYILMINLWLCLLICGNHERFETILNPDENVLQFEIDRLKLFTDQNLLKISQDKSSVMLFNKSKTLDFPPEVRVGQSDYLSEKTTSKMLGVIINNKADFKDNTKEMIRRATKKLWLLRRLKQLGLDTPTVLEYWVSEGRPLLEYACALWTGSLTVLESRSLEAVQRSAMAICFNRWDLSYLAALARAGLPRLDSRRKKLARTWGERAARQHGQTFFTPNPVKTRGAKRFLEPYCRTNRRMKSAIPYITRLLNS